MPNLAEVFIYCQLFRSARSQFFDKIEEGAGIDRLGYVLIETRR